MKYDILQMLRDRGDYVSGEEIGEKFNVSRAAVWKNISKLKAEGYIINSVSNRGYLLEDTADVLNEYEIDYDKCIYREEVSSTNDVAKEIANIGCEDGAVVVCGRQIKGKGRLGREWAEINNDSIAMSMVLHPDISPMEAPQITLIAGIAVARALRNTAGVNACIKWPNDIVVNGKKICGILTEMNAEIENIKYVVVGIGVNVNQEAFEGELKEKATSLYIENNKRYRRNILIRGIINELNKIYNQFINENGFAGCRMDYLPLCINIGKKVKAIYRKSEVTGEAVDVNENGELVIKTQAGDMVNIFAGEVSIRLEDNRYV